jgi:long-chain acyl-CoA synthetase
MSQPWFDTYPDTIAVSFAPRFPTLLEAFRATVDLVGVGPFIHHFDHSVSASSVDVDSDAFAYVLQAGGLNPRDRVAICLQNDPQWLVSLLGAWKAGAVVVPLNPMVREKELQNYLTDSSAQALITSRSFYTEVASNVVADVQVRTITMDPFHCCGSNRPRVASVVPWDAPAGPEDFDELVETARGRKPSPVEVLPTDIALLTYTSGTTGPPKGAMNTHANVCYNGEQTARWFLLTPADVVLAIAPLFHITGLIVQIAASLFCGAPLVLFHRFEPAEALHMIEQWHTTYSVGAITAYIAMMSDPSITARDLSSMKKVSSGGAPVSPKVVERFETLTGIYIHNCYGLTETTAAVTLTPIGMRPPVDPTSGALSVGLPCPGVDISFADPTTRESLPIDATGEIVIAGPMVVAGYWMKPEETEHALPDGHLHTGDIGFMDDAGWLYIVDRAKDQINASGYKVWPREVEDVLYQHPSVKEAAVVGTPDPYRGETVEAFVVLHDGSTLSETEAIQFCKCPRTVIVRDTLPKTLTGKILRRELRDMRVEDLERSNFA